MAEWLGKGLQNPVPRFDSGCRLSEGRSRAPRLLRAISSGGERFLDAEEVSGSNPLSPTTLRESRRLPASNYLVELRVSHLPLQERCAHGLRQPTRRQTTGDTAGREGKRRGREDRQTASPRRRGREA